MKKSFVISLTMIGLVLVSSSAFATLPVTTSASVSATISGTTSIEVAEGPMTIDFPAADPGGWAELSSAISPGNHHRVNMKTNDGSTWYFKMNLSGPLTSGSNTIPVASVKFSGQVFDGNDETTTGTNGTDTVGWNDFSVTPITVYTSGPDESSNLPNGHNAYLRYALAVPTGAAAGTYGGASVVYTLTATP